ncbi:MAG: DUF2191 domain-containing protein [Candidatus Aminicenantes bacterium]|nr:DUF2191 domain-containing protein [Candidatus Aminicenantes bacterium]
MSAENDLLDELVKETGAGTKAEAILAAIRDFLRRRRLERVERILAGGGRLEFDLGAEELRPDEP